MGVKLADLSFIRRGPAEISVLRELISIKRFKGSINKSKPLRQWRKAMIDILKDIPTKPTRSSKLSNGQPVDLQSQGHSVARQAKQLEVAQRPVCNRLKKVGM